MRIDEFRELWLTQFEFHQGSGERLTPVCLTARECRSGQVWRLEQGELSGSAPPYPLGPDVLFIAYDAPAQVGCHLALGWPVPARILDLHAEFRCLTSGLELPGGYDLAGALAHFGLRGDSPAELLEVMMPQISLGHALLRGQYAAAVARMEAVSVPIDVQSFNRLREGWGRIQDALIQRVDSEYGVYQGRKFNPRLWSAWLNHHCIPWPRVAPRQLDLSLDTFKDMAKAYPEVRSLKELRATLSQLRPFRLAVGMDGRNRCPLRPFASKTGRNQPSTAEFIFGPAKWLRGLIQPPPGQALAYVDYEQQEFGIAAALSGDPNMQAAYQSGDPYLVFARQAEAAPPDATKQTHKDVRERCKHCALGVQYGMGARSLATRLGVPVPQAHELLRLHKATYPAYWRWSKEVGRRARQDGKLTATFGWMLHVGADANPRSVRNWPLQANGAEMLRLACCSLTEAGVRVCAPVHDALLIEAPAEDIEQAVAVCQRAMGRASECVLTGFPLRTEAKVLRHPDRLLEERGRAMWQAVFELLDREAAGRCA